MRKVTSQTALLADLLSAQEERRAVRIRYVKIKTGEISRRSIEILKIWVDNKGDICVRAWDRRDGDVATFRLDHITNYTLHRSAKLANYTAPVQATDPATATLLDDKYGEITGFASWDLMA